MINSFKTSEKPNRRPGCKKSFWGVVFVSKGRLNRRKGIKNVDTCHRMSPPALGCANAKCYESACLIIKNSFQHNDCSARFSI
jgi:hypothetical protein